MSSLSLRVPPTFFSPGNNPSPGFAIQVKTRTMPPDNCTTTKAFTTRGATLLLIHGNGTQIEDFETSGLIDLAAQTHRVIVFEGFGHSSRPRSTVWTPTAQALLLHKALAQLGIECCIVLGHSWGAAVAVALALRHASSVKGLVLVSGYYYPTDRFDAGLQFLQASPIIGDVLRPLQIERVDEFSALVHEIDDTGMIHRIVARFFSRHLFGVNPKRLSDGLDLLGIAGHPDDAG